MNRNLPCQSDDRLLMDPSPRQGICASIAARQTSSPRLMRSQVAEFFPGEVKNSSSAVSSDDTHDENAHEIVCDD